jgi:hypothetical protein
MAKEGINESNLTAVISSKIDKSNWSLCIGAGCSFPIFPLWDELAQELIKKVTPTLSNASLEKLKGEIRPDSLIQSTFNRTQSSHDEYVKLLGEVLYSKIKSRLSTKEWIIFKKCISAKCPSEESQWKEYVEIIEKSLGITSSYHLAKLIVRTLETKFEPSYILTFNAEPFLYSLINAFIFLDKGLRKQYLDFITQSISTRHKKRIPYIFCHGFIPVPEVRKTFNKKINSADKLVFLENEYSQLANNSYSWQAASFMEVINTSTVVFIGLSLTDPNMRRWLSWTHASRLNEIRHLDPNVNDSTKHYWINLEPSDLMLKKWYEASVAHLGVRLIWLKDWANLEVTLKTIVKI